MRTYTVFLFVALASSAFAATQKITEIHIATSTLENSEVDGDGKIGIEIINSNFEECIINALDNPSRDDFERGTTRSRPR